MSIATICGLISAVIFCIASVIAFLSYCNYKLKKENPSLNDDIDFTKPVKRPSGTVNIHPKRNKAIYTSGILKQGAITSRTFYALSDGEESEERSTLETKRLQFEVINRSGSDRNNSR